MRYFVGFMMCVFLLAGVSLLTHALLGFVRRLGVLHRLERAEGGVVSVERKKVVVSRPSRQRHRRPTWMFLPVITFTDRFGKTITFTSETGSSGETSRFRVGQRIGVRYDPEGELDPMIDSWAGLWMPTLVSVIAGAGFVGGAALIYVVFGERIFGA